MLLLEFENTNVFYSRAYIGVDTVIMRFRLGYNYCWKYIKDGDGIPCKLCGEETFSTNCNSATLYMSRNCLVYVINWPLAVSSFLMFLCSKIEEFRGLLMVLSKLITSLMITWYPASRNIYQNFTYIFLYFLRRFFFEARRRAHQHVDSSLRLFDVFLLLSPLHQFCNLTRFLFIYFL